MTPGVILVPVLADSDFGTVCLVVAFVVLAILSIAWTSSRSHSLIDQWAAENGYRVVSAEQRWLQRGPFFWTTSKGQTVYRVTIEDVAGRQRSGYVRCGSWMGGLLSDKVQVRWDDER